MKLITFISISVLIVMSILSCSPIKKFQKTPIGLINNASFIDTAFNNSNAANGFLVENNDKTYAITAKHVLMIAKTDKMKFIDFEGDLKEWRMHPKNDKSSYLKIDKLLSTNKKDSLTWSYVSKNWDTYNDWLVFSVKENHTNHTPLKFRKKPLKKGESLYIVGWSYKDSIGAQRVYEYVFDKTEGNYHNLIQIKGPKRLGGLSGAPIIDKKGKVVGLVSSGGEDEKTKKIYVSATDIKNAMQFIYNLD